MPDLTDQELDALEAAGRGIVGWLERSAAYDLSGAETQMLDAGPNVLALVREVRRHRAGAAIESHRMFCAACEADPSGRSCAAGYELRLKFNAAECAE